MSTLAHRWNRLPRATKWAVYAGVGFALYFGALEPVLNWTTSLGVRAQNNAERLKDLRAQADQRSEATTTLKRATRLYGDVLPPGPRDERVSAASQSINSVLRENDARNVDFSSRAPSALRSSTLPDFVGDPENQELQRVSFDVSFEATPERAVAIIAALERVPEITLIADLGIDRSNSDDERLVEVSLSPEVWVVARKGGAR